MTEKLENELTNAEVSEYLVKIGVLYDRQFSYTKVEQLERLLSDNLSKVKERISTNPTAHQYIPYMHLNMDKYRVKIISPPWIHAEYNYREDTIDFSVLQLLTSEKGETQETILHEEAHRVDFTSHNIKVTDDTPDSELHGPRWFKIYKALGGKSRTFYGTPSYGPGSNLWEKEGLKEET